MAFDEAKLAELDKTIEAAIADGRIPGAVLRIEAKGHVHERVYGHRALKPKPEPLKADTIFDAASLTKVVSTTPSIVLLLERGDLKLNQTVTSVIPEFKGHNKEKITILQLLTHTSGLLSGIPKDELPGDGYETNLKWVYQCEPKTTPDAQMIYSDLNYLLLGEIVRRVTGENLDTFAKREIWEPLGMKDTTYNPGKSLLKRIAPTEKLDDEFLHGVVHDPTCRRMGGVSGNAGMFSTAADLSKFARMMLDRGKLPNGKQLFKADSIDRMIKPQIKRGVEGGQRGLGWDIDTWLSVSPRGKRFA
ncbi:MAG: serine hydrolase domain-containing protein, partial [Verrucomicrobiota bacterium]